MAIRSLTDRARSGGFTLLELMLTLAVAAVLAAVAIPNMRDFIRNNRLTAATNDLLRSTQLARSEAIKRRQMVVVCAAADPEAAVPSCSYGAFDGWIVFEDFNNNWAFDDGEEIVERHALLDDAVTVRNDEDGVLSYAPSGFANPAGAQTPSNFVVICDERGAAQVGANSLARAIIIEPTGRTRATRLYEDVEDAMAVTGSCPS